VQNTEKIIIVTGKNKQSVIWNHSDGQPDEKPVFCDRYGRNVPGQML
jgi:hypothetical protein